MESHRWKLALCLFLVIAPLATFWQLTDHDFINFDDDDYVTENPYVQAGLDKKTVFWAFTAFHSNNWHPLTWLSHALDCQIYGLNPGMHHLTNLLLHIANGILLFLLLTHKTDALWSGAFVAALFALHPLHVESVAWVSERKDVLGAFFWMLTLLAYVRYAEQPKIVRYLPVFFLFALGLMAKPMLVTLPCVLLLMDYWPLDRLHRGETNESGRSETHPSVFQSLNPSVFWEKIPLFALTVVSSILTVSAQKSGGLVRSLDVFPLGIRLGNALVSYMSYIVKMIWPQHLAFYYPHPGASLPAWKVLAAGLLLTALTFFIVKRKAPLSCGRMAVVSRHTCASDRAGAGGLPGHG